MSLLSKFSPHTTSDKAGSVLIPIDFASDNPGQGSDTRVCQWTVDTFEYLSRLYSSAIAGEIELCLLAGYDFKLFDEYPDPWWKDLVFGFRNVSPTSVEAQTLNLPRNCKTVWAFTTYMINCQHYLPWLMHRFVERGGMVEQSKVHCLKAVPDCSIVINCSGLGAAELVRDIENCSRFVDRGYW